MYSALKRELNENLAPRGIFISFEGVDGSGKTTQSKLLEEYIRKNYPNMEVVWTREPGGTKNSEEIRSMVLTPREDKWSIMSEVLLFQIARRELMEKVIVPALNENKIVIVDRFIHSTYAYQCYGTHVPYEPVSNAIKLATDGIEPDVVFLADVPVHLAAERTASKAPDRFESMGEEFFTRVRHGFLTMAIDSKFRVLNGMLSVEAIASEVASHFEKLVRVPEPQYENI